MPSCRFDTGVAVYLRRHKRERKADMSFPACHVVATFNTIKSIRRRTNTNLKYIPMIRMV
jgi:hypothetical protein